MLPGGLALLHNPEPIGYLTEVAQLTISLEDRNGGAAPWTTSLASAA
jgi:hypothetical protein